MFIERIVSEGIAHNSYIIGSGAKAAIIDPRRDIDIYLVIAKRNKFKLTHIFETHRNEDYVSGSNELRAVTGAEIYHGHNYNFQYGNPVRDGDIFRLNELELKIIETPGHTYESISIAVIDNSTTSDVFAVFSGDTLFSGDTGRTDFYGTENRIQVSEMLYNSITKKLLALGDGVIIYPAHGAGSVCGSEITSHPLTTIGYEKKINPVFNLEKNSFIQKKTEEHHYLPPYFQKMEELNTAGAPVLGKYSESNLLSLDDFKTAIKNKAQILDIRSPPGFSGGHIKGSLNIWRDGLSAFVGYFLNYNDPVVLVDDYNLEIEPVIRQLIRLGYDNLAGVLGGGYSLWYIKGGEVSRLQNWSVHELHEKKETEEFILLDVRDIDNLRKFGSISSARHLYVGDLSQKFHAIPKDKKIVIYCDAGYKGSLAGSFLLSKGYRDVINILGGFNAWINSKYPVIKVI